MEPTISQILIGIGVLFVVALLIGTLLRRTALKRHQVTMILILVALIFATTMDIRAFEHNRQTDWLVALIIALLVSFSVAALGVFSSRFVPKLP